MMNVDRDGSPVRGLDEGDDSDEEEQKVDVPLGVMQQRVLDVVGSFIPVLDVAKIVVLGYWMPPGSIILDCGAAREVLLPREVKECEALSLFENVGIKDVEASPEVLRLFTSTLRHVVNNNVRIPPPPLNLNDLDTELFRDTPKNRLYDVILLANSLSCSSVLRLGCAQVAALVRGQPLDQIREILRYDDDAGDDDAEAPRTKKRTKATED